MTGCVYIVDDDAAVRSALSLLIRSYGWQPVPHESAESFLRAFAESDNACLLLDLDMPQMNGAELCEHLQQVRAKIPVVVVTAHQDHPLARRAIAAGAHAVVPKPVDDEELLTIVQRLFATPPTA